MSEITINDLPAEIIIKIFKRIDEDSAKKAVTLTCKLWKELIESSCSWSLTTLSDNNQPSWMNVLLTTEKKFSKIEIHGLKASKNIIDIFKLHGHSIVKLSLTDNRWDSFELFVNMLKCLPNLEYLSLYQTMVMCDASDVPRNDNDLPSLKRLKTLEMVRCSYNIVKYFKRSKLKAIKYDSLPSEEYIEAPKLMIEFLKSQNQLATLAVSYESEKALFFRTGLLDWTFPFHLSRLSLFGIDLQRAPYAYDNILKFMKYQAEFIMELELGNSFPDPIYELIFTRFVNLKTLRLWPYKLPQDLEFYKRLEPNRSISKLVLLKPSSIQNFVRLVPNVTEVTLRNNYFHNTVQDLVNLHNLKKLAVDCLKNTNFGSLQFPKLTSLNIDKMDDDIQWDRFTEANPSITELTIHTMPSIYNPENIYVTVSDYFDRLTRNLNLHILRIGSPIWADESFFNVIRDNCPHLKILDLHESCVGFVSSVERSDLENFPGLYFHNDNNFVSFEECDLWKAFMEHE